MLLSKNSILANLKEVLGHGGFRKYLKSTGWMLFGKTSTMAISLIATFYIARNLGPANYGELSYALGVISLIGFIAPLGLDGILYRELIRHPEKKHILLGTTFLLRFFSGLLVCVATISFALFFNFDDVSKVLILVLSGTFLFNSFHIVNYEFLSRSQAHYQAIILTISSIILNILKILVIFYGQGVIYLACVLLFESILLAGLYTSTYLWKSNDKLSDWSWNLQCAKEMLRDSFPIIFVTGFTLIYAKIDIVFIKKILGAEQVGLYDAAVRLVDVWNFIPAVLGTALFPAIVNAEKHSYDLFIKRTLYATLLFFLAPLCISTLVWFFSKEIILLLYGDQFFESVAVLKIYIWSLIGTSLGIHVQAYLTLKNYRVLLILSSLIPMIVNISLNLLWIPSYGIIGAAYATVISYSLIPLFLVFKYKSFLHKSNNDPHEKH